MSHILMGSREGAYPFKVAETHPVKPQSLSLLLRYVSMGQSGLLGEMFSHLRTSLWISKLCYFEMPSRYEAHVCHEDDMIIDTIWPNIRRTNPYIGN